MTVTYFYDLFHFNRFLICSTTKKQEIVFTLVVWLSLFNSALCQACGVFSFLFCFFLFLWNYRAGLFVSLRKTQYWFCFEMVQLLNFKLTKLTFWKTPRRRTSMNTEIEESWMKNNRPLDPFFQVHPNAISFHVVQFDPSPNLFL